MQVTCKLENGRVIAGTVIHEGKEISYSSLQDLATKLAVPVKELELIGANTCSKCGITEVGGVFFPRHGKAWNSTKCVAKICQFVKDEACLNSDTKDSVPRFLLEQEGWQVPPEITTELGWEGSFEHTKLTLAVDNSSPQELRAAILQMSKQDKIRRQVNEGTHHPGSLSDWDLEDK